MDWSEKQFRDIDITERLGSVISLIGSAFVVISFCSSAAFRKPIRRLVFYASFGNILSSVSTLIARDGIKAGQFSALCQLQSFFIQQWMPADALWAFCMALNIYLTFHRRYSTDQLKRLEWRYFLVCYGLPLPVSLTLWFAPTPDGGRYYGPALIWCSIAYKYNVVRVACFYAPAWCLIGATAAIYAKISWDIVKNRKTLSAINKQSPNRLTTSSVDNSRTVTVEVGTNRAASSVEPYSINIHSDGRAGGSEGAGMGTAVRSYFLVSFLFFLALVITWLPSTINRMYSIVHPTKPVYALNIMAAFVLSLQGFWNAVIYLCTSLPICKEIWTRKFSRKLAPNPPELPLFIIRPAVCSDTASTEQLAKRSSERTAQVETGRSISQLL